MHTEIVNLEVGSFYLANGTIEYYMVCTMYSFSNRVFIESLICYPHSMTVNAYREKETAILKEQIDKLNSAIYKEEAKAKELEMKAKYVECELVKNIFPPLNFEPTYHLLRKKLFSVFVFGDFQHPLF